MNGGSYAGKTDCCEAAATQRQHRTARVASRKNDEFNSAYQRLFEMIYPFSGLSSRP